MFDSHSQITAKCTFKRLLVLVAALLEINTPATALAAQVYVAARFVHYIIHVAGIPYLRTVAFFVGVCATLVIAAAIWGNVR